jgi:hypothetical protein
LIRRPPFLDFGRSTPNRAFGASTRTAQGVATIPTTFAASRSLAAPNKRSWIAIPSACGGFKPRNDFVWLFWRLPGQRATLQDALDGLTHIEPRTT